MLSGLNQMERLFCEKYVCPDKVRFQLNGKQAAIAAGYSEKTAASIGSQLLTRLNVRQYVEYLKEQQRLEIGVSAQKVLREMATIGLADPRDLYDDDGELKPIKSMTREQAALIDTIEESETAGKKTVKVKLHSKTKALDSLAKHFDLISEAVNVNVHISNLSDDELNREFSKALASLDTIKVQSDDSKQS